MPRNTAAANACHGSCTWENVRDAVAQSSSDAISIFRGPMRSTSAPTGAPNTSPVIARTDTTKAAVWTSKSRTSRKYTIVNGITSPVPIDAAQSPASTFQARVGSDGTRLETAVVMEVPWG